MPYCLAIDIGASGGRHILGEYINGEIRTEEIYRFENEIKHIGDNLCWDIEYLTQSVLNGIKKCSEIGKIPDSIAIDTWGVDYVLLDGNDKEILPVISYRDNRTEGIPEKIDRIINAGTLYSKTGIQRVNFNTIYQLYCDKKSGKLNTAEHILMMPEYLSYKLTGVMKSEYTIASTTSLVNSELRNWDRDIIGTLGLKPSIFKEISMPGTVVGRLSEKVKKYVGFDSTVLFAPSHDTASAFAACDLKEGDMYISSGTWSLVGTVQNEPVLNLAAMNSNFTNEGGVNFTYRFLKNVMGMWLFQNIRKNLDKKYSYDEMMYLAMESKFTDTFDPNDSRLVSPDNMIEAIKECLQRPDLEIADVLNSVYHTLAQSYKNIADEIESIMGERINKIIIVGGGSKDKYLNLLTEKYTAKPVVIGPTEATALGNLKTQFGV